MTIQTYLCTKRQWRTAQAFTDAFWRRWLREYLPSLLPRNKWRDETSPVKVGDVVLFTETQHREIRGKPVEL